MYVIPLLGGIIGGFELVLILAVVVLMYGARKLSELTTRLQDLENSPHESDREKAQALSLRDGWVLFLAQGLGAGEIPFAPGTFGSLIGILFFGLLVSTGSIWLYALGIIAGFFVSVWACGEAEKILKQSDPSSVVIDEIIAIPICFTAWVVILMLKTGQFPTPDDFFSESTALWTVAVFAAFRCFDIAKPPPVYQSQSLPGGWGVTMDDVLAALYVNLATLIVYWVAR